MTAGPLSAVGSSPEIRAQSLDKRCETETSKPLRHQINMSIILEQISVDTLQIEVSGPYCCTESLGSFEGTGPRTLTPTSEPPSVHDYLPIKWS